MNSYVICIVYVLLCMQLTIRFRGVVMGGASLLLFLKSFIFVGLHAFLQIIKMATS